ncbi:MAG: A/G-specific adenine glycosylase [Verrucomicrobiae bacterium]|nr:A/G-specific adenine glycosylase [Verrucomicrobiae bacterium]NNJ42237.1 A/G-specific adenine glycosylase [Akkermansiaceae bacterium]
MPARTPTDKPMASKHPLKHQRAFQQKLVRWFKNEGKPYPWRDTTDPWAILVSEIMLQQTQIATVLGKGHYVRFMAIYPTPCDMAQATEQEILKAWEGLGYYRRAKNLHAAARAITRNHNGHFPRKFEEIRALPGIGPYTAGAVASFAYNDPQPIVDANVARVFSRLFDFQNRIDTSAGNKQLWQWAEGLLPAKAPRDYNSALMELGQTYCSNKSPDCAHCPVQSFCHCADPTSLPIKKSATKVTRVDEFAIFSTDSHGRILLQKQQEGKRRAGMWSLPRREHDHTLDLALSLKTTYAITRYHVTLRVYASHAHHTQPQDNEAWHSAESIESLPMPSPDRRALETILSQD